MTSNRTFLEAYSENAEKYASRTAFVSRAGSLTYQELESQSDALACHLGDTVGTCNEPIVLFGHKSPMMLVCMLACAKSGHPYVPVDISTPPTRTSDIIAQAEGKVILACEELDPEIAGGRRILLPSDLERVIASDMGRHPDPSWAVHGEDTFYIIFTSGSTGAPKGVQITASCLDEFYSWPAMLADVDSAHPTVFLNQALFSFDLSVYDLALSLSNGGTLACADGAMLSDQALLFDFMRHERIQVMSVTPSFLEMCLVDHSFESASFPDLSCVLLCGEPLHSSTVAKFFERFGDDVVIYNTYGPTESTVAVTAVRMTRELADGGDPLPVGYPKQGTSISIVDGTGAPLPDGDQGEIVITGTTVSKGYLNRPDLTERSFSIEEGHDRSYRTGDVGHLDEDGLLYCAGRMDSQVKLNGFRIELGDIECNLVTLPYIRDAAVVCRRREGLSSYLAAFVVVDDGASLDLAVASASGGYDPKSLQRRIKDDLASRLPHYMVPRKVIALPQLPMTSNGKVDRMALEDTLR